MKRNRQKTSTGEPRKKRTNHHTKPDNSKKHTTPPTAMVNTSGSYPEAHDLEGNALYHGAIVRVCTGKFRKCRGRYRLHLSPCYCEVDLSESWPGNVVRVELASIVMVLLPNQPSPTSRASQPLPSPVRSHQAESSGDLAKQVQDLQVAVASLTV